MRRLYLTALLILLVLSGSVAARTWYIKPDGTGDAPTIKAGVDSAVAGDSVFVADGTYYESNIRVMGKSGLVLVSESGQPEDVTIDAQRQD
jgi:pectate lyase